MTCSNPNNILSPSIHERFRCHANKSYVVLTINYLIIECNPLVAERGFPMTTVFSESLNFLFVCPTSSNTFREFSVKGSLTAIAFSVWSQDSTSLLTDTYREGGRGGKSVSSLRLLHQSCILPFCGCISRGVLDGTFLEREKRKLNDNVKVERRITSKFLSVHFDVLQFNTSL